MNFQDVIAKIENEKLAAYQYEQEGHHNFRDVLTITKNGKACFERYCYGEAASHVCTMWADELSPEGKIVWNYDECSYSGKESAPVKLTKTEGDDLYFDGKEKIKWIITDKHKKFKDGTGGFWGRRKG